MTLSNERLEQLSDKVAHIFAFRMKASAHLLEDLKQEAAIAMVLAAPKWRERGGANIETFVKIYAWRAMQELCAKQSGPVARAVCGNSSAGTSYGVGGLESNEDSIQDRPDYRLEVKQADEVVREFVSRRAKCFTGKGKLSKKAVKSALQDLMSGDTCHEIGQRYGCSKQYISMLAAQAKVL